MADAFTGEIRMFPYGYAPVGWLACNGQQVSIGAQTALYSLLGNRFGGDNRTYFNLPNLNGRIPVNAGKSPTSGQTFIFASAIGQETVTLTLDQAPPHTHDFSTKLSAASIAGMTAVAGVTNNVGTSMLSRAANSAAKVIFAYDVPPSSNEVQLGVKVSPGYGTAQQGVEPHPNLQPYLVMGYFICTDGDYPINPN